MSLLLQVPQIEDHRDQDDHSEDEYYSSGAVHRAEAELQLPIVSRTPEIVQSTRPGQAAEEPSAPEDDTRTFRQGSSREIADLRQAATLVQHSTSEATALHSKRQEQQPERPALHNTAIPQALDWTDEQSEHARSFAR